MSCFFITTYPMGYDLNVYITYVGGTSIFYLAILNFVNFVERKQDEIDQVLKEKEKAIVDLQARNINLQQFSYICSHDFKEPLINIGSFSGLIQKKLAAQQLDKDYEKYFEYINSSVLSLSNILKALQVFTDINSRNHLSSEKIVLKELFNNSSQTLSSLIEEKNAKVVFNNESGKEHIYSSAYGLELIIQNLVQNALKYNQALEPEVTVTLQQSNKDLLLKVKDNGVGVDEKYLRYIFEPFKTMNNKRSTNSTGLGLAICKEITNKISGEIWAESAVGKGSTFYVQLKNTSVN